MKDQRESSRATQSVKWAGAVAFVLSLAANVAATINGGMISVITGAATPILMMLAIHMWRHAPVKGSSLARGLSFSAMGAIVAPVAITSYYHAGTLLSTIPGMPIWLAWVTPLSVDGLAIRAVLVLQPAQRPIETKIEVQPKNIVRSADIQLPSVWSLPAEPVAPSSETDLTLPTEQIAQSAAEPVAETKPSSGRKNKSIKKQSAGDDNALLDELQRLMDEDSKISKPKLADRLGITPYKVAQLQRTLSSDETAGVA